MMRSITPPPVPPSIKQSGGKVKRFDIINFAKLAPTVHGAHFWFAWAALQPATPIYQG